MAGLSFLSYQNDSVKVMETNGEQKGGNKQRTRRRLVRSKGFRRHPKEGQRHYDWRKFSPDKCSLVQYLRWLVVGGAKFSRQSSGEFRSNLEGLADCLTLLRQYSNLYGMPSKGGIKDQEMIIREITRDLYAGGTFLWALEYIMQKVGEGLLGDKHVCFLLLPRRGLMSTSTSVTTSMFTITRGFDVGKMEAMEPIAVRLASFACNTSASANIPSHFPSPEEFSNARMGDTDDEDPMHDKSNVTPEETAKEILDLAAEANGVFFFVNSKGYENSVKDNAVDNFWIVTDEERELFTRLACIEAMEAIGKIDADKKRRYPSPLIIVFRVLASAGASGFWFGGSWIDMFIAGILAVFVAVIGQTDFLSKQERVVFEVIASFIVGLVSGLIALQWPDNTCFGAMALAGVLDILQGFRIVFAVIQIMSKYTVAGSADLLEGILFTGLIAYFLRFGQYAATSILSRGDEERLTYLECENGIDPYWYILFVPLAALSWSGLFTPSYGTLIPMCLFGCLGFGSNYALALTGVSEDINNFVSAAIVTFSAGLVSRFTGKQAVGNTISGLYVLLPGAYWVKSLYDGDVDGSFFTGIVVRATGIGIGAWTGTVLCSPTLLGVTRGLVSQQQQSNRNSTGRTRASDNFVGNANTMLVF